MEANARSYGVDVQLGQKLLRLIAILGCHHAVCLALAIVALPLSSIGAKACIRAHASVFSSDRYLSSDVVFKGRVIAAKSKGPIRTYAVEHTYKGPHRDDWKVIAPFGDFWTLVVINGDLQRSLDLPASDKSFIIGIRKFGASEYDQHMKNAIPEIARADAKYIVAGGDSSCPSPQITEFTPRLGAEVVIAVGNLDDETAAE